MEKVFLTTKEISKRIGIPEYTIRRYVNDGIIPAYRPSKRVMYFDIEEVIKALKEYRI